TSGTGGSGNNPTTQTAGETLAETGSSSALVPAGITAAALAVGGAGIAFALHRRRNRTGAAQ
ncbi:peptidase, partial [Streptomyces violascens]